MWHSLIILIFILTAQGWQRTTLDSLHYYFTYNINSALQWYNPSRQSYGITPCLVNIFNHTAVSMACSSKPSLDEVRKYIYQHICRPQDEVKIRINCHALDMSITFYDHVDRIPTRCWCGEVHFDTMHGWAKLSNLRIINKPKCDSQHISMRTLQPHSLELYGLPVSTIDISGLTHATIVVFHDSLTTPPSLLELVNLHSLQLLSLRSPHYASILQQWMFESSDIQFESTNLNNVMELADLEIIHSNISQIPDRIFTVISVKVALSLAYNAIQTISADTFRGLPFLRSLYLQANQIAFIHRDALKTLQNLHIVDLHNNQIQVLDSDIFLYMNGDLPLHSRDQIIAVNQVTGEQIVINATVELQSSGRNLSIRTNVTHVYYYKYDYANYVKSVYVDGKVATYSATADDYFQVTAQIGFHIFYTYLEIELFKNPIQQSQPCFNVYADEISTQFDNSINYLCFCNIGNSGRVMDINTQTCKQNTHTPGVIRLEGQNITTISVLKMLKQTLLRSTHIEIYLRFNDIRVLTPSDTWLPHITNNSNISMNFHIDTLQLAYNGLNDILPGAWMNIIFEKISLAHNNLTAITNKTFQHLDTKILILQNSKIQHIQIMAFKHIKRLYFLELSNNLIHRLSADQFPPTLQRLYLGHNKLTNLEFHSNYLGQFDVSNNHIRRLTRMINRVGINVGLLSFQDNLITFIEENTFQYYAQIYILDISYNFVNLNFTKRYFGSDTYCEKLLLSHNKITSVSHIFYHIGFRRMKDIDLSHNYITEVDFINYHYHIFLKELNMAYNKIRHISPNVFENMNQKIYANFKGNKVHHLYFMPTPSQGLVADFTRNPLHCSCNMRWLREKDFWHIYKVDVCKDFVSLRQVRVIDVPLEDFVCETPCTTEQCNCYGPHVNQSSVTTHVTCSGQGLIEVPHPLPPLIQVLNISHNNITHIHTFTESKLLRKLILSHNSIVSVTLISFNGLPNLKILMIDHNLIEFISFDNNLQMPFIEELYLNNNNLKYIELSVNMFNSLPQLHTVDLRNNKLPYLNRSSCHQLSILDNLLSVKLSGNPWDCDSCSTLDIRYCLRTQFYNKVSDVAECRCISGNSSVPLLSMHLYNNNACTNTRREEIETLSTKHKLLIAIDIILGTIAVFLFPCLVFRIRYAKYFRVICQHMSVFCHNDNTFHPLLEDQYDANLVYDSDDQQVRHWVVQTLLHGLEQNYNYKIYIEERDQIPVGCPRNEANYKAITNSQRTIVVLSENFHRDNWKQDAVDQAFLCWKYYRKNKLIFVAYDSYLGVEEVQNELRALVQISRYIPSLYVRRGDIDFWTTLVKKMPKHRYIETCVLRPL